jgi:hypothetical protein
MWVDGRPDGGSWRTGVCGDGVGERGMEKMKCVTGRALVNTNDKGYGSGSGSEGVDDGASRVAEASK